MAWWKTAKAGDKIVCVDDSKDGYGNDAGVRSRRVYTVSRVGLARVKHGSVEAVWICEATSTSPTGGYRPTRFRPVDPASKKADRVLASLKPSLLNPIPIRKHETAGGE